MQHLDKLIYVAPAAGVLALIYAFWRATWVGKQDAGSEEMRTISGRIREGAMAFLTAEYKYIGIFVVIVAAALAAANMSGEGRSWWIAASFVCGAGSSGLAGYFGMRVATNANVRTTQAATKSLPEALQVAFSGGSVMGMSVVGLALVGLGGLFILYKTSIFSEGPAFIAGPRAGTMETSRMWWR